MREIVREITLSGILTQGEIHPEVEYIPLTSFRAFVLIDGKWIEATQSVAVPHRISMIQNLLRIWLAGKYGSSVNCLHEAPEKDNFNSPSRY